MIRMLRKDLLRSLCVALSLVCGLSVADATDAFPSRPIKIIVNGTAGGGTDIGTRLLAKGLEKVLNQSVIVMNRPGGGGLIGTTEVAKAAPDCYTAGYLAMPHLVAQNLNGLTKLTLNDFTTLAQLVDDPSVIAVLPDAPWKTFKDLADQARRDPGSLTWADAGVFGNSWLVTASIGHALGVPLKSVHYPGAAQQNIDLLGGHVNVKVGTFGDSRQEVKNGTMRLLAVAMDQRAPNYPDVPTLKELGMDIVVSSPRGIVYPLNTPQECVAILGAAIEKVSQMPDYRAAMEEQGLTIDVKIGDAYRKFLEQRWKSAETVIRAIGAVAQ